MRCGGGGARGRAASCSACPAGARPLPPTRPPLALVARSAAAGRGAGEGAVERRRAPAAGSRPASRRPVPGVDASQLRSARDFAEAIAAEGKAGRWEAAVALLGEMQGRQLEASGNAYSALVAACKVAGRWQVAVEALCEMQRGRLAPSIFAYSAAIGSCEQGRHWQRAVDVLSMMRGQGSLLYRGLRKVTTRYLAFRGSARYMRFSHL